MYILYRGVRGVEHSSFHFESVQRQFVMCMFGECPGLCTIRHSWMHVGVLHMSLHADGKVAFEEIPVLWNMPPILP